MRSISKNIGYFLKETATIIKVNILSNFFSLLSTALIFFIVAMVISGWWTGSQVIRALQEEAEINVYYTEAMSSEGISKLTEEIEAIEGVRDISLVDQSEAYGRMKDILGKEAQVLEFFDDNPFSPFIEVRIDMQEMDEILAKLQIIPDIEHVRDNREVLGRLQDIARVLKLLGYLLITAVAVSTLVIIAHIIRQGIYNNREQIETMRLLGAPEGFIAIPFLLSGLLITIGGGILASILSGLAINYLYVSMTGPLPFIPLPPKDGMMAGVTVLIMLLSMVLGAIGSAFGLSSARRS